MRQIFKLVNITTTKYIPILEAASWLVQPKKLKGTEVIFSTSSLAVNCINYEKKKRKEKSSFCAIFWIDVTKRKLQINQE